VTATIADEAVRRYYRQDFNARLAQYFAPPQRQQRGARETNWREPRGGGNWRERRNSDWPRHDAPRTGGRAQLYVVVSRDLAASPVHRGHRTMVPRREALILLAALNHPWLLHDPLEELASLEFRHPDAEKLKAALIDIAAHAATHAAALDPEALKAELAARNLAAVMDRMAGAITTPAVWGSGPEAAPDDVLVTWQQLVALHRQWHSLTKE